MKKPLVSVALCTYNGATHLAEQLDSIISQTYRSIEIIVVDDCSSDSTFAILSGYAAKYPQFKIYQNKHNLGFVKNFEHAATLCTGELIALCDQDDIWHPEKIALQVDAMQDNILVYHDSEFVNEDGSSMNKKVSDVMNFYGGDNPLAFLFFNCVSGNAIMMKKELLDEALPLKEGYFHDWWLAYVATNIGKINFISRCLIQYRQHQSNNTNMLGLAREKDNYKFSSIGKMGRTHKWLGYCAAYPKNKYPQLVREIYEAYTKLMDTYVSTNLSRILLKYRDDIFYVRKKSRLSKLNYIYKQVWGVRTKKLF